MLARGEAAYLTSRLRARSMSKSVLLCISTLLDGGNHYSKMFNLSDSLGRPLFANIQISLVCSACLKTDEPEKCVSIQTHAAVRHSLSRSLCRFAGARTSWPRCQDGCRQTRWYALFSHATCTQFFLSMPARVPFAGNRQGHPRRCAYVFPRWSPDAELVCAQN